MRGIERDTKEGQEWQQEGKKNNMNISLLLERGGFCFVCLLLHIPAKKNKKNNDYTKLIREMQVGCI